MDIEIKGDIIEDDMQWIYDWIGWSYTSPRNVVKSLKEANGEDILLKINSPGGSVFAASEIYTELRNYAGNVNIEIIGLAASAASVIAMSGKSKMSPTAQMMVHNVSTRGVSGDYRVMEHTAETLKSANETIANAYIAKSGISKEQALKIMDNETWLTAEGAKNLGLIDEIMFEENKIDFTNLENLKLYNSYSSIPNDLLERINSKFNSKTISQPKDNNEVDFFTQQKTKAQAQLNFLKLKGGSVNE